MKKLKNVQKRINDKKEALFNTESPLFCRIKGKLTTT